MPAPKHALAAALTAALAGACGGEEEAPAACEAPSCPVELTGIDLMTPTVGFTSQVLPLFRRSCGLSSTCHGSPTSSAADLYLGPKKSDTTTVVDAKQLVASLVNVPSKTAPASSLVKPADPAQSFLMLKVDGCQNAAGLACTPQPKAKSGTPCGDRMPQSSGALCADDRDLIRRWIAQGAASD